MYYRAKGKAVCADVIPYYEDGTFYLFYLRDYRDFENHGEGCPWCLLTTKDLVHYEDHGEVLVRGSVEDQDLYVFTGSCTKHNGEYYIYYTGHNPHKRRAGFPEQKVLLAKSKDLYHWEKVEDFVLEAPEHLEMHDYRDPFIFFDEEKQKYCMLLAGRVKNDGPINSKGVTLVLHSEDMLHWQLQDEPFYAPNAFFTHECPDVFKMGDWWYLIFSEFTDKVVTTYRMAKSPSGPWITPKVNNFDGHAFYAAKTASDGQRRFLFGWNCIKNHEQDHDFWQWGGTVIPHEIVQAEDGTLFVKCPQEIQDAYQVPVALDGKYTVSTVKELENGLEIGDNEHKSLRLLAKMPENCKIELDFTTTDEIGDFGVLLRSDDHNDNYYAVKFEPKFNRMAFDQLPRRDGTVHVQVDVERYCPLTVGEKNHMVIIVDGTVAEVYVNGQVAMSVRMFDHKEGYFGLYSQNTAVNFENIRLYAGE